MTMYKTYSNITINEIINLIKRNFKDHF